MDHNLQPKRPLAPAGSESLPQRRRKTDWRCWLCVCSMKVMWRENDRHVQLDRSDISVSSKSIFIRKNKSKLFRAFIICEKAVSSPLMEWNEYCDKYFIGKKIYCDQDSDTHTEEHKLLILVYVCECVFLTWSSTSNSLLCCDTSFSGGFSRLRHRSHVTRPTTNMPMSGMNTRMPFPASAPRTLRRDKHTQLRTSVARSGQVIPSVFW